MTDTTVTETEAAAELALASADPHPLDDVVRLYWTVVPDSAEGSVLDLSQYGDNPQRKTGASTLISASSFVQHVKDHQDDATRLYALPDLGTVTAVFDDHTADTPGWGQHRATLTVKKTREWLHWEAADNVLRKQADFADHIEDGLLEIVDPDGATMLELAQSFQAHTTAVFRSSDRLSNGERQFTFDEDVQASAGRSGQLVVPERFVLGIRPYEGTDAFRLEARLRWRLSNGALTIGYKLDRPHDVLRAAFDEIVSTITVETGLTPMLGTPAQAR